MACSAVSAGPACDRSAVPARNPPGNLTREHAPLPIIRRPACRARLPCAM